MKLKLLLVAIGLISFSTLASESSSPTDPSAPPDKAKLSYAVGMRMGTQLILISTNLDMEVAAHAIQDVLDGKPTMIQESDIAPVLNQGRAGKIVTDQDKTKFSYAGGMRMALLFKRTGADVDVKVIEQAIQDVLQGQPKMKQSEIAPLFAQAEAYEKTKDLQDNKNTGESFLAKNAKKPGIQVLPDGLQYQVIKEGDGPLATPDDLIFVKFRGTFINGVSFDQHPHFLTRTIGGIQGWKDVLPKMKVGSEWKIFVPPSLAFGHDGESYHGVGPDVTVIYDIQLQSIAPPGGNYQISSGLGHGLDMGATTPEPGSDKSDK